MPANSPGNSQNFLHSAHLVNVLLDLTNIQSSDFVYEIGPGKGQITSQLMKRCQQVIAIEKDKSLYEFLQKKFINSQLKLRHEDFLVYPLPCLKDYKVFSNIPFDQTTAIMKKLTEADNPPQTAYLILQKEAAFRFMGYPHETLRSMLLKPWFEMNILHVFHRTDFTSTPNVDAVFVSVQKRDSPFVSRSESHLFRDFLTYTYTAYQPNISRTLKKIFTRSQMLRLHRLIAKETRPSQITMENWLMIYRIFQEGITEAAKLRVYRSEEKLEHQQLKLTKVFRTRTS